MFFVRYLQAIVTELKIQSGILRQLTLQGQQQTIELAVIVKELREIDRHILSLTRKLFPTPTTLTVSLEGAPAMANATITKQVGQTVHGVAKEFDNTQTPPAPFTPLPSSLQWSQDTLASGSMVVNPDGSFDLTGTAAGTVVGTCLDSVSNPGTTLKDTFTMIFVASVVVPNELDVELS